MTVELTDNIRLYDAIMAILYSKGQSTFNDILCELEKLNAKGLLDYTPDAVWRVLVLATTMKTVKVTNGKFEIAMRPRKQYKELLEKISGLIE